MLTCEDEQSVHDILVVFANCMLCQDKDISTVVTNFKGNKSDSGELVKHIQSTLHTIADTCS